MVGGFNYICERPLDDADGGTGKSNSRRCLGLLAFYSYTTDNYATHYCKVYHPITFCLDLFIYSSCDQNTHAVTLIETDIERFSRGVAGR